MLRHFLSDSFKYLILKAVVSVAMLVSIRLYTGRLSPEEFGHYTILVAFLAYAAVTSTAWLVGAVVRFLPESQRDRWDLSAVIQFLLGRSCAVLLPAVAVALWALGHVLRLPLTPGLFVAAIATFVLTTYSQAAFGVLRARREVATYLWLNATQVLTALALSVLCLYVLDLGVEGILLGTALPMVWVLWRLRDVRVVGWPRTVPPVARKMLHYGLPILGINLFTQALSSSDQMILKAYGHAEAVGVYAASYMLAQSSVFALTAVINSALNPVLFQAWESGQRRETLRTLYRVVALFAVLSLPVVVGFSVFARPLVSLLVDPRYAEGYRVVPWVVSGAFFVGVANVFSEIMTLRKKTFQLMTCYGVAAAANLALNFIYVPRYGMMAAAVSTFASYLILLVAILVGFFVYSRNPEAP